MGSIPGCCWVQSYQRHLKMGVVSSCMVLTMKEGPQNITGPMFRQYAEGAMASVAISFIYYPNGFTDSCGYNAINPHLPTKLILVIIL